jgi:hypothetical protein
LIGGEYRRRNEECFAAETTPVPLLTLSALKALLDLQALNSINVRGGTCHAEAGGTKKIGWVADRVSNIQGRASSIEYRDAGRDASARPELSHHSFVFYGSGADQLR